jgi:hypothetical protein
MSDFACYYPKAYVGVGSDIKWCNKAHGGKRCLLCHHYAKFEEWSAKYKWHYLVSWCPENYPGCVWRDYAHNKVSHVFKQYNVAYVPSILKTAPVRYRTTYEYY